MKKTILITGSTDGIGKLVALSLAKDGHEILMHGRNQEKLDAAISELKTTTNNENITGYLSDLSDLEGVVKMASQISSDYEKLDVLINNAGVFKSPIVNNRSGIDLRLVVNYLAPNLLTKKLMPLLENAADSRIINLSSAAQGSVSLEAIKGKAALSTQEAYAQSKLALTMWSFDLARKTDVNVIAVNPGSLLNTKMVKEAYGHHWSAAEKGSDILYDLAVDQKFNDSSGKYYDNDNGGFMEAHPDAYNQSKINELIKVTDSLLA